MSRPRREHSRQWGRLTTLLRDLVRAARDNEIGDAAAAITYYGFTALPATMLATVGIAVVAGGDPLVRAFFDSVSGILSADSRSVLEGTLERAVDNDTGSVVFVCTSLAVALWSATGAMTAVMRGLNRASGVAETRGFVRKRLVALGMLLISTVGLLLCAGLLVLGPVLSDWAARATGLGDIVRAVWWAGQWPVLVVCLGAVCVGLLRLGPDLDHQSMRSLAAGSGLTVLVWIGASLFFALYVARFDSYNKAWGTLSAPIVTIVWMWLGATALLLGAELNAYLLKRGDRTPDGVQGRTTSRTSPRVRAGGAVAGR